MNNIETLLNKVNFPETIKLELFLIITGWLLIPSFFVEQTTFTEYLQILVWMCWLALHWLQYNKRGYIVSLIFMILSAFFFVESIITTIISAIQ